MLSPMPDHTCTSLFYCISSKSFIWGTIPRESIQKKGIHYTLQFVYTTEISEAAYYSVSYICFTFCHRYYAFSVCTVISMISFLGEQRVIDREQLLSTLLKFSKQTILGLNLLSSFLAE